MAGSGRSVRVCVDLSLSVSTPISKCIMIPVLWIVKFMYEILETMVTRLNRNELLAIMDHSEVCGLPETLLALLLLNLKIPDMQLMLYESKMGEHYDC